MGSHLKKQTKNSHASDSVFVVMKEDRRAEMACLWLFKSKDGTKLGAVINVVKTENRALAYRNVIKWDNPPPHVSVKI